jgi:hypothetical protein
MPRPFQRADRNREHLQCGCDFFSGNQTTGRKPSKRARASLSLRQSSNTAFFVGHGAGRDSS